MVTFRRGIPITNPTASLGRSLGQGTRRTEAGGFAEYLPSTIVGVADWLAVASGPPLGSGRAQGLAVRYPIAKARGLDPYSVPGCPGAGLSEPPFPIL